MALRKFFDSIASNAFNARLQMALRLPHEGTEPGILREQPLDSLTHQERHETCQSLPCRHRTWHTLQQAVMRLCMVSAFTRTPGWASISSRQGPRFLLTAHHAGQQQAPSRVFPSLEELHQEPLCVCESLGRVRTKSAGLSCWVRWNGALMKNTIVSSCMSFKGGCAEGPSTAGPQRRNLLGLIVWLLGKELS